MELPKGRRTLAANFFNTTVKPNIRSKLGMRSVVDTLTCIMIFLIIITVAPSLTGASPIAGFTMTEVSEQSEHHSTHSAHSRMRINTEEFENIVRIRSVYPVMSECLGRMSEESVHNVTKLSPPAMHLLGAMGLTFALPVIFMVLYGLISIFTFLVEIGVAAIKSDFSPYRHIKKNENPRERCMLIASPYSSDIMESEDSKSLKYKFKHKSQHFESEV
jgi:hypothetical protein